MIVHKNSYDLISAMFSGQTYNWVYKYIQKNQDLLHI